MSMREEKITEGLVAGFCLMAIMAVVFTALMVPKGAPEDRGLAARCAAAGNAFPGVDAELVTGPNGEQVCQLRDASGRLVRAIQYR